MQLLHSLHYFICPLYTFSNALHPRLDVKTSSVTILKTKSLKTKQQNDIIVLFLITLPHSMEAIFFFSEQVVDIQLADQLYTCDTLVKSLKLILFILDLPTNNIGIIHTFLTAVT